MGADGDARRDRKGGMEREKEEESGLWLKTGWLLVDSTSWMKQLHLHTFVLTILGLFIWGLWKDEGNRLLCI